MRALLAAALVLAAALPAQPVAAREARASRADARLRALYDGYWQWQLETFHRIETARGEVQPGDALPSVAPAAQAERLAYYEALLARLDAIDVGALSAPEQANAAVLRADLAERIGDARFREWEMPFDSDSSFWSYLDARRGFETVEEYDRYLARIRQVPRYFDEQIANARAGLERGFSVPRVTLAGRDASVEPYTRVEGNPFGVAFEQIPERFPETERARLRREGRAAIAAQVVPAYAKLLAFLREDYLPNTRETLAAEAVPDGAAWYAQNIRQYTTLDLGAEEIHKIGLAEVARIEGEMRVVMAEVGFTGTIAQFNASLKSDPRFVARTPDELMGVSAYVAKRVDGRLEDMFGFLPRKPFTIRPVPDAIAPFYTAGRGGEGACQMNTHDLPSRPLYNIPALTLHECTPGHSFQFSFQSEQAQVPDFRRNIYFSGMGEGWGLYCEFLGEEMGIYRTPYERFGRLSYEMWRAVRLVIDTGIHHYGWSREKAVRYLADRTALSDHEVGTEVDRYISWPGQALAYKLGEMTIRRMRAKAEAALGERFDIRKFHDVVLALGSVPLPLLEARIDRFIAEGGKGLDGVVYD
ncbi:hypothetical protein B2G71_02490 [Novosphingobium sp. PC22D]|uniref:DUF885 domain-containing protein n=1 Tax=Novosphingobium sp. PC22D TaxID=1962403 RepID=UPI000BEFCEA3|nr:DUF885 family protein [Novosphingobium sp. PC22D]PEQ14473.1 hypothetical protein B2G71_02490 [Novosphingobium sp. PC22D]